MPWDERCGVSVCVCVLISTPYIYRREPRPETCRTDLRDRWGGDMWQSWGGGAHGPGGRPRWSAGLPEAPTAPNFLWWAVLACLVLILHVLACVDWISLGFWATLGPFEPESALWYFLWFSVGPKCACNLHISSKIHLAYSRRWSVV